MYIMYVSCLSSGLKQSHAREVNTKKTSPNDLKFSLYRSCLSHPHGTTSVCLGKLSLRRRKYRRPHRVEKSLRVLCAQLSIYRRRFCNANTIALCSIIIMLHNRRTWRLCSLKTFRSLEATYGYRRTRVHVHTILGVDQRCSGTIIIRIVYAY